MMDRSSTLTTLTERSLLEGISCVARTDADLASAIADAGIPPLWSREPGFPTLVHIILEQQVSLASARVAFTKLTEAVGHLTPERFLGLTDAELLRIGFSRQKRGYCRALSTGVLDGELDLGALAGLDDATVRSKLMERKGIGPWTADIYLLMALLRPDVWPSGDLALAKSMQRVKRLASRPATDLQKALAERWRPWRAVAARILWHHYLSCNG